MKRLFLFAAVIFFLIPLISKADDDWKKITEDPSYLHRTMKEVTDVMVHDIYSPPVASRIYAYVSVAGYETAISSNKNYYSFAGQLHALSELPRPDSSKEYSEGLAAIHAMLLVAKSLIISEDTIEKFS